MVLHQYDYLLAVGSIFAFLDAWNIGANDVANSWATAVSSRSLTYLQAMCAGSVMEFVGAVGVGGRVADTIRTKVVNVEAFAESPGLLMLGMVCAVTASSLWLTMATRFGMPVSTTHSILGGVLGMGYGALGSRGLVWVGYKDDGSLDIKKGVVQVFLAWVIAPGLAGTAGAIIFLITKYGVMLRSNPVMKGLMVIPMYFWLTSSLIVMLLLWKGGDYEVNLTDAQLPGVIIATGAGFAILIAIFLLPWVYRVVVKEDWELRAYHIVYGPLLLRRGEVPPPPENFTGVVRNFYDGHLTKEELETRRAGARPFTDSPDAALEEQIISDKTVVSNPSDDAATPETPAPPRRRLVGEKPDAPWYALSMIVYRIRYALFNGVDRDIVADQNKSTVLGRDMEEVHARAAHFDNHAEFLYTFLQIMTSAAASFVHGANDVANAVGPFASIYQIWRTEIVPPEKADVPRWVLAAGGAAIVIGLWTYGYHIMSHLGNRITLMSPSRGFSMELGSVIAVIIATRLKLPVSTTQCMTGGIVGVGLCNGDIRSINWRMVAWIYFGWILTVPCAAIISGCLMGFVTFAPNW